MNLNGLACKRDKETVILHQFTRRCYTKHWKAKSIRIIESTLVQQKKITALYCKINFVFAFIDKANNYITCLRSCCTNFFTVVRWNVTFFGFFKTCKLKKSVDYNKKMSLLKKGVISYKPKLWLGFFCYFLFIYKRTPTLLLHMNRNQMTLIYRNVIDFNFLTSLTRSSVANIL